MAIFGNPFVGNASGKMSEQDLIQALRVDIAGQLEAIVGYEAHASSTNDERVKKVLYHIFNEEKQHVGELEQLINMLNPNDAQLIDKGRQEVLSQQSNNFTQPMQ
jgi:rubrerythrin